MTFRIEIMWQIMWQVLMLTFTFTFLSNVLLYHTNNATGLSEKTSLPFKNVFDLKIYSLLLTCIQLRLSNLSADRQLAKAWGLPPLSITVGGEIEKPVG